MLSIDELRERCQRIYFFGLGFIQVVVSDQRRYHFYHPDLPAFVEQPHNHRYDFSSKVLRGALTQRVYTVEPGDTHIMSQESCDPDKDAPRGERLVRMQEIFECTLEAGSTYGVLHSTFHTVSFQEPTVTQLSRSGIYRKEFAWVTRLAGTDPVCPFSKVLPEEDLWGVVRSMSED